MKVLVFALSVAAVFMLVQARAVDEAEGVVQVVENVASQMGVDVDRVAAEGLSIPSYMQCNDDACTFLCVGVLGFAKGTCSSDTGCRCSK